MNFLLFGLFLVEFCSASRCRREKDRIKELFKQKRELQIERDELAAEKGRFCNEYFDEINELNAANSKLKEENEELKRKLEALQTTTATTQISTTTTTAPIEPSDVFILVIPKSIDESYLQSGDGSSQISATINDPENNYAPNAAFALVNGQLHIFGGSYNGYKIARLDGCSFNELPARLNERRRYGHAAVSVENGQKALVCFGAYDGYLKSCEIFDSSAAASTFAAEWTHQEGALGLFNNQPATVGCWAAKHQKAETLSAAGWTALPDHPLKISEHSLVGLENRAMLLLGGSDDSWSPQTGIWQLKEEWSTIGELSKPALGGSAIYVSRSVYYFEFKNSSIHRVELDENEELEAVQEIRSQPGEYIHPVLFQTSNDYCT